MKGKFLLVLATIVTLLSAKAYASENSIDITKNFSTGLVSISGAGEKNAAVTVQILPNDLEISSFAQMDNLESKVVYTNDCKADENGGYEFLAKLTKSGNYSIYIKCQNQSLKRVELGNFTDSTTYQSIINENVNSSTDADSFADAVTGNLLELGFDNEINSEINTENVAKLMYNELGETKELDATDYVTNIELYEHCLAIEALNKSKTDNVLGLIDDIVAGDEILTERFKKHVNTEEKQKYFTSKMSSKNIEDVEDLILNIKEALILSGVRYPDGYMNIQSLFDVYKDIIGLNNVSAKDSPYIAIAGNDYTDVTSAVKAYKAAISAGTGQGGASSPSSPGSNRVSGTAQGGYSSIEGSSLAGDNKDELSLKFTDLGSVLWAYPSISILYEAGIVDGVSEYEFCPERTVKREEFVKMLIGAMGLDSDYDSTGFLDVDENEWYAQYINAAFSNGIVKGISNTHFGIKNNISRQDMAVMVYNGMIHSGYSDGEKTISFDDASDIADYAKEAVAQLSSLGIINGVGNNTFLPRATATRAESAVIIQRALDYLQ